MFRTITNNADNGRNGKSNANLPKKFSNKHQFDIGNESWQQPYLTTTNVFYQQKDVSKFLLLQFFYIQK